MLGTWGVSERGPSCNPGLGTRTACQGSASFRTVTTGEEGVSSLEKRLCLLWEGAGSVHGLSALLCRGRSCLKSKIRGSAALGDGSSPVRNTEPVQGGKGPDLRAVPELSRLRSGPCSSRAAGAPARSEASACACARLRGSAVTLERAEPLPSACLCVREPRVALLCSQTPLMASAGYRTDSCQRTWPRPPAPRACPHFPLHPTPAARLARSLRSGSGALSHVS